MRSWVRALTSSVGMKIVMAVTGLGLVLFLSVHMLGNLEFYRGPEGLNGYAAFLRVFPPFLWIVRLGLIVFAILHVTASVRVTLLNRAARNQAYTRKGWLAAGPAARTMMWTGLVIAIFLPYHLMHFTFQSLKPEYRSFEDMQGRHDVFSMVTDAFHNPIVCGVYVVSVVLLAFHLTHAVGSWLQSLGLDHPRYSGTWRRLGPVLATIIALGFISVPLAILLGWVAPPTGGVLP